MLEVKKGGEIESSYWKKLFICIIMIAALIGVVIFAMNYKLYKEFSWVMFFLSFFILFYSIFRMVKTKREYSTFAEGTEEKKKAKEKIVNESFLLFVAIIIEIIFIVGLFFRSDLFMEGGVFLSIAVFLIFVILITKLADLIITKVESPGMRILIRILEVIVLIIGGQTLVGYIALNTPYIQSILHKYR